MAKSRGDLPNYADWNSIHLSRSQFAHILKGRVNHPVLDGHQDTVRVAKTKDGQYWAEWRGDTVFWARRWHQIPAVVGERAEKIEAFVGAL